jgi:hypothetical protein
MIRGPLLGGLYLMFVHLKLVDHTFSLDILDGKIKRMTVVAHEEAMHDVLVSTNALATTLRHLALVWQKSPKPLNYATHFPPSPQWQT